MKNIGSSNAPRGWLIDPNKKWLIHFYSNSSINKENKSYFNIDVWGVMSDGAPAQFKSRRKANYKEGQKVWSDLKLSGWKCYKGNDIKVA